MVEVKGEPPEGAAEKSVIVAAEAVRAPSRIEPKARDNFKTAILILNVKNC
jgi:hypothetical protein